MGSVYLARDREGGGNVAVKVLHAHLAKDKQIAKRFAKEARAMRSVHHPNVAKLIDVAETDDIDCYVMELLDGRSLRRILDEHKQLPLDQVYAIAMQSALALEAVHLAGIIHRDVKPDNIFLAWDERGEPVVKLLDFGVAKLAINYGDSTGVGAFLGTPEYMAPEQMRSGAQIDGRTDVYALGCVMYEMLTGRKPLQAKSIGELIIKLMAVPPRAPSEFNSQVPPQLDRLVLKCLEKSAFDRPRCMRELEFELLDIADAMNGPTKIERRA
jgi:serine/threonine protein kinase